MVSSAEHREVDRIYYIDTYMSHVAVIAPTCTSKGPVIRHAPQHGLHMMYKTTPVQRWMGISSMDKDIKIQSTALEKVTLHA